MGKYVLKRLLLMLFTFFVIVTITFMLIRILPVELPVEKNLAEAIKQRWEALGYNKPLLEQYGIYLKNIFTKGDFGTSFYYTKMPVTRVIFSRIGPSMLVGAQAILIGLAIGL